MITYKRCLYIDQHSRECSTYFATKEDDEDLNLCPLHSGILGPRTACVSEPTKVDYINLMNEAAIEARGLIHSDEPLNLDQLDQHIAGLEAEIEKFKSRASAARGVKADHLSKLSEEQRRELRKIRVPKEAGNGSRQPKTQEAKEESALGKLVKTLMATTGKSEEECTESAKMILGI